MRKIINNMLRVFAAASAVITAAVILIICGIRLQDFDISIVLTAAIAVPVILCGLFFVSEKITDYVMKPIEDLAVWNEGDTVLYEELKPLVQRLSDENEEKAEIERIRREFTANASHELKTPLTTISGYAQMMAGGMAKQEDMREFSERIEKESRRMLNLIDDIINLSNLDEGGEIKDPEEIDLAQITAEAIIILEKAAKERGVQIYFSHTNAGITGDPTLIGEMVYNLIDNAIKYNKENGRITVFVGETTRGVELYVRDTGIGIAEEDQERIFERFYRVDKSHSKRVGGTGLGLSIVKHVCALHGASVRVSSKPGKGSTFNVTF